jgi:hypothetical protein
MVFPLNRRTGYHLIGAAVIAVWVLTISYWLLETRASQRATTIEMGEEGPGSASIETVQREWKEIFLGEKKVGYAVSLIHPTESGYFLQEEIFLRLNLMGLGSSLHTVTQCRADRNFLLENFLFTIASGVVQFRLSGRREGDILVLESGKGKDKREQTLGLSKPPMIGAAVPHFFKGRKLTPGDTFSLPLFDPSTLSQKEMAVRVLSRETLKIGKMSYETFRLNAEAYGKSFTVWVGEDGSVLKEEGFMGLTTVKSSAARAAENLGEGGGADLYEITAVKPDRVLPDPKRLRLLKVALSGLENANLDTGVLNGPRQEFHTGILVIRREDIPVDAGYRAPYPDEGGRMKEFLRPEWNIESDQEEIRKRALQVFGEGGDPIAGAKRLLQWVYEYLEKKPVLSLPSALETLRTGVGDCNEHATLLTALLRAAGIPAKLSVGLVYSRDRFFYHAWTEAYLGEWISLDATLNQMPVDPGHIKLIEGNIEKQVEIAGLVGEIKMKVLDFQYD